MLSRLLEAHESILIDAHDAATKTAQHGDDGTNDLIVSNVIHIGELQVWFLAKHLVDISWETPANKGPQRGIGRINTAPA